jgi:hypothetical protein
MISSKNHGNRNGMYSENHGIRFQVAKDCFLIVSVIPTISYRVCYLTLLDPWIFDSRK